MQWACGCLGRQGPPDLVCYRLWDRDLFKETLQQDELADPLQVDQAARIRYGLSHESIVAFSRSHSSSVVRWTGTPSSPARRTKSSRSSPSSSEAFPAEIFPRRNRPITSSSRVAWSKGISCSTSAASSSSTITVLMARPILPLIALAGGAALAAHGRVIAPALGAARARELRSPALRALRSATPHGESRRGSRRCGRLHPRTDPPR